MRRVGRSTMMRMKREEGVFQDRERKRRKKNEQRRERVKRLNEDKDDEVET